MANIKQCAFCKKLYQDTMGTKICLECTKKLDASFLEARNYLYEHDNTSYGEIIENTEVTDKELSYLIKSGRLTLKNAAGSYLKCAVCGSPTASGSMCVSCAAKFAKEAKAAVSPDPPQENKNAGSKKPSDRAKAKRMWTQHED